MANCGICGNKLSLIDSSLKLNNGKICKKCVLNAGFTYDQIINDYKNVVAKLNTEDFNNWAINEKALIEKRKNIQKAMSDKFSPTYNVFKIFKADEKNKILFIKGTYYTFEQLVSYELCEDNSTIMEGGIGRAIVGDALFGAGGALLGAMTRKSSNVCQKMEIVINLDDEFKKTQIIPLIDSAYHGDVKRDSIFYKNNLDDARQIIGVLEKISKSNDKKLDRDNVNNNQTISAADEIRKFKSLLDDGIITKEEFEKKKKELLN